MTATESIPTNVTDRKSLIWKIVIAVLSAIVGALGGQAML